MSRPRVVIHNHYGTHDSKLYATAEPSQFGGFRPIVKLDGRTIYAGQAQYTTSAKATAHATSYADQYTRGISEPRVPHRGDYPSR